VKAWESKNAKNAARAGGISLLALSLAACGGSSDTTNANADADAGADQVDDVDTGTDEGDIEAPVNTGGMRLTITDDVLPGTDAADAFVAKLTSTVFGSVANTLSSADEINGGGGVDTLDAQIISEFIGFDADDGIDIQPTISDVEVIRFEARDTGNVNIDTITVDAKDITGHESVGSFYSDGDLVIENMNSIADNGDIRLTSDLTVSMAYTDSFNSDGDASDLFVLFDEDYLNTSTDASGSTLTIQVVNAVTNVDSGNPLFGTTALSVNVGSTVVTVDLSAIAADETLTFATAYDAAAEAINAAMVDAGITTVTAAVQDLTPAVFSIGVTVDGTDYVAGDSAGSFHPILLTNTGAEELTRGDFTQAQTDEVTDINSNMASTTASDEDVPISINIDLEKVGRDGEGGDLVIGAKDLNLNGDTDVDQNDGIEVFNINVIGDSDLPSNLGLITSTNGELKTVNIATDAAEDGSDGYAALTVRGMDRSAADDISSLTVDAGDTSSPFLGTLTRLDADEFLGDLAIGEDFAAFDIDTFTATGGGDVTLLMDLGAGDATDGEGSGNGLASTGVIDRSVTTGAGDDDILLDINGGAQATVNTGAGDDTFTADIDGNTDSTSSESALDLTSASGDNTVTLSTNVAQGLINAADVDLGTGADTVTGGSVALTVDTNAANDVIYADNTGAKSTFSYTTASIVADLGVAANSGLNDAGLLYGETMTITLAMPEADGDANSFVNGYEITNAAVTTAGYISTAVELNQSIADAINADAVINKLVVAEVASTGTLTVTYLVDGAPTSNTEIAMTVEFTGTALNAAALTTDQSAFIEAVRAEAGDSTLSDAAIVTDINGAGIAISEVYNGTLGTGSVDGGGDNVLNGGTGDDVIVSNSEVEAQAAAIQATIDAFNATIQHDTVVIDAGDFGNDVIVHFNEGITTTSFGADGLTGGGDDVVATEAKDFLSFEFLDNMTSASGSVVTQVRIDGTVAVAGSIIENSVVVLDVSDFTATSLETLTEAGILADINADAVTAFDGTLNANTVGTTGKAVLLVEDDGNTAAGSVDNEGHYDVYEVTYTDAAGVFTATSVNLAGSLDFGEQLDIASGNII
jgi:hypothetical protein